MIKLIADYEKWLHGEMSEKPNLRKANLSGVAGTTDAIDYIEGNFETVADGIVVYKVFGLHYAKPKGWDIRPGATINEVCNPTRTDDCGYGINVATKEWIKRNTDNEKVWKCLIRWPWLAGVVVPYNTDGKIRCSRIDLVECIGSIEGNESWICIE